MSKNSEVLNLLKKIQKRKEQAVIKINQYILPSYLVYLALKKKKPSALEYKFLLTVGTTNIIMNWPRYRETLRSLFSDQKKSQS